MYGNARRVELWKYGKILALTNYSKPMFLECVYMYIHISVYQLSIISYLLLTLSIIFHLKCAVIIRALFVLYLSSVDYKQY